MRSVKGPQIYDIVRVVDVIQMETCKNYFPPSEATTLEIALPLKHDGLGIYRTDGIEPLANFFV